MNVPLTTCHHYVHRIAVRREMSGTGETRDAAYGRGAKVIAQPESETAAAQGRGDHAHAAVSAHWRPRLDALTALRFVAAALIVAEHSAGNFGFPDDLGSPFVLDQAVSFFFILSGFILTYVYPTLPAPAVPRFLRARVARVWPGHVTALLLLLVVAGARAGRGDGHGIGITLANLLLVQSWIPLKASFFSYNTVSWSISTELGFYLLFPLLIRNWERSWRWKLPGAFLLVAGLVTLINVTHLPASSGLRETGLLYVNPLGRLFEFTLGMAAALTYGRFARRIVCLRRTGTIVEIGVLMLVVVCMAYSARGAALAGHVPWVGAAGAFWLREIGCTCLAFAALIVVMALGRGGVSRALASPPCVLLGEISFAVYLLHPVVLRGFTNHARAFLYMPAPLRYAMYWAVTLLAAHLVWALVETPARRWITQPHWPHWPHWPQWHQWSAALPVRGHSPVTRRRVAEGLALAALMLPLALLVTRAPAVDWGHLDAASCTQISGWAWDEGQPDTPVTVLTYDNGQLLGTALAGIKRGDLQGEFGNGAHGFIQPLPPSVRDGDHHTLRVVVATHDAPIHGSPRTLTCPATGGLAGVTPLAIPSGKGLGT